MKNYVAAGCALVSLATSISLSNAAFSQVAPGINGANVRYVKCGSSKQGGEVKYFEANEQEWYYYDQNEHSGTAEKVQHDEWSVYLHDDQGADVVLDMHKKICTWRKDDNVRMYKVLDADNTIK